jgi:hypothetical protein
MYIKIIIMGRFRIEKQNRNKFNDAQHMKFFFS